MRHCVRDERYQICLCRFYIFFTRNLRFLFLSRSLSNMYLSRFRYKIFWAFQATVHIYRKSKANTVINPINLRDARLLVAQFGAHSEYGIRNATQFFRNL